jgi:predicted ArsR family transcriptional regulator
VASTPVREHPWTFLTNHGHVLLAVALDPDTRVDDIAARVGITARQALNILRDLEEGGYLRRERRGRRTHYTLSAARPFRHPLSAGHEVGELLAIFVERTDAGAGPVAGRRG